MTFNGIIVCQYAIAIKSIINQIMNRKNLLTLA